MFNKLFVSFFLVIIVYSSAFTKTLIVDAGYSFIFPFTCEGMCFGNSCYNKIKDAVNDADNGDDIKICPGTYNESNIKINKDLEIYSTTDNPNDVVVQESSKNPIFNIQGWRNGVSIKGITVNQNKNNKIAILISMGTHFNFENLIIESSGYGISQSSNNVIQNTIFKNIKINSEKTSIELNKPEQVDFVDLNLNSNKKSCIVLYSPSGSVSIYTQNYDNNTCISKQDAIDLGNSNQNYLIKNVKINTTGNNSAGITFKKANNLTVENCYIDANNAGSGIWSNGSISGNFILRNTVIENANNEGVYIKNINGYTTIENNKIINSGNYGIYLENPSNGGNIRFNLIRDTDDTGLRILKNNKWRGFQVDHNCFINNDEHILSRDKSGNFDDGSEGNYWDNWNGTGSYKVPDIPKYDHHPLSDCPILPTGEFQPIADYHFDECEWNGTTGEVIDSTSNGYNGTAHNNATTEENGLLCKAADFTNQNYVVLDNSIPLNNNYTVTVWIDFPFDSTGHTNFNEGWSAKVQYYNIADRAGSDNDFIYFKKYVNSGNWKWCVDGNSGNPTCKNFNMNITGWHLVAFVGSGNSIRFYIDGSPYDTINKKPTGTLNFISASDYQNDLNGQTIGSYMDEFKVFNKSLSQTEIHQIYDNGKAGKNWDGTERSCPACTFQPVADWHFDECGWNGNTGEIKDSTSNHYDGTSENGALNQQVSGNPPLCRIGYFDGANDYIKVSNLSNILNGTASLSFWIKTMQTGNNTDWKAPGIAGIEQSGGTDDVFWGWIDANGHIGISAGDNYNNSKSHTSINNGHWHHIVLTRNAGNGHIKIYIDGNLDKTGSTKSGVIGTHFTSIGRIENSNPSKTPKYFNGYLDEVKVFDSILSDSQVKQIYNNESSGENWDGTNRICNDCSNSKLHHIDITDSDGDDLAVACEPELVCFTAKDKDNKTLYNYTGEVKIDSFLGNSSKGKWYKSSSQSENSDPPAGDLNNEGNSTVGYIFKEADKGKFCIFLENKHLEQVSEKLGIMVKAVDEGTEDKSIIKFFKAAFKIYWNKENLVPWEKQISCKETWTNPKVDSIAYVQSITTNDKTGECEALFQGFKEIKGRIVYIEPSSKDIVDSPSLYLYKGNTIKFSKSDDPAEWSDVSLDFNNGIGKLNMTYPDAGKIRLEFAYDLDGTTSNGYEMLTVDSHNEITFSPFGLYVDFKDIDNGDSSEAGSFNTKLKAGSDTFIIHVRGVCYDKNDDVSPKDGLPDKDCNLSDNKMTLNNFKNHISLKWKVANPAQGSGDLKPNEIKKENFVKGVGIISPVFSDVGVLQIDEALADNYIINGNNIKGWPYHKFIGRFVPHHFKVAEITKGVLDEKCSVSNYTGEPTSYSTFPSFKIIAQNKGNGITKNYMKDFFKLSLDSIKITSPVADNKQVGTDGINNVKITVLREKGVLTDNGDGTATYKFGKDQIKYLRESNSKIAPFSPDFSFTVTEITDKDDIKASGLPVKINVTGLEMKYGRIKIADNYGPETENLNMDIKAEFWNGSSWILNDDDSCTVLNKSYFKLYNFKDNLNSGETSVLNSTGINKGIGKITLSAPGKNNTGSVDITLYPNVPFYDYLDGDSFNATAHFGIYRGRDRIIMWQEVPVK